MKNKLIAWRNINNLRYADGTPPYGRKWRGTKEPLDEGESEAKLLSRVQLFATHYCSLPGSSVHGILQARILEWVAIPFSRGSSQPRDQTQVCHIAGRRFTIWATREAHQGWRWKKSEKASLKLNVQKMKIMGSSGHHFMAIDGETMETVTDFIFFGSKIIADDDSSHDIKRHLFVLEGKQWQI